jgi:hypothetical protein
MILEVGVFESTKVNILDLKDRHIRLYRFEDNQFPFELTPYFKNPSFNYHIERTDQGVSLRIVTGEDNSTYAVSTDDLKRFRLEATLNRTVPKNRRIATFMDQLRIGNNGKTVPIIVDTPLYLLEKQRHLGVVWRPLHVCKETQCAQRIEYLREVTLRHIEGRLLGN